MVQISIASRQAAEHRDAVILIKELTCLYGSGDSRVELIECRNLDVGCRGATKGTS